MKLKFYIVHKEYGLLVGLDYIVEVKGKILKRTK